MARIRGLGDAVRAALALVLVGALMPLSAAALFQGGWSPSYYEPSRVNGVAFSPAYGSDSTVLAATGGGMFYSTDSTTSWKRSSGRDTNEIFYDVAISPAFSSDGTVFSASTSGVRRSTDRGATFVNQQNGFFRCVEVSPDFASDGTVMAGSLSGIKRSTDGGATWQDITGPVINPSATYPGEGSDVFSIGFSPDYATDSTVFCFVNNIGTFKSTDGGSNWAKVAEAWDVTRVWRFAFSPDFASDRTVFASSEYWRAVYKSTDGGDSWDKIDLDPSTLDARARVAGLVVSPGFANDHTLYAAAEKRVYTSTNGGESWTWVESGASSNIFDLALSPQFATSGEYLWAPSTTPCAVRWTAGRASTHPT